MEENAINYMIYVVRKKERFSTITPKIQIAPFGIIFPANEKKNGRYKPLASPIHRKKKMHDDDGKKKFPP